MKILATHILRSMRGATKSQLVLGEDDRLWVVKFRDNPQHPRVLANEWICTRLAHLVGLSVPATRVIEVNHALAVHSEHLRNEDGLGVADGCATGLHFGTAFAGGFMPGQVFDFLPEGHLKAVRNINEFGGMLALDKWTGNCDARQAVFERSAATSEYSAVFIDQGACFNAGNWNFPDAPLHGVYRSYIVYSHVRGWESFEPWLSRLETLTSKQIKHVFASVPPEWYLGDSKAMDDLMNTLLIRRSQIRSLIGDLRASDRTIFPLWDRLN